MRATEKLQKRVLDELAWDPSVDSSEISVTSSGDGVVTLEGVVPRYREKKAAEKAVKRVAGVRAVANDLEVRLLGKHRRDDTRLAEAAVRALEWHSYVPKDSVKVTVDDGWVTLEGKVRWEYQRREAHDAVRDLVGVKGVTNQIELKVSARPEDVRKKIEAAFRRSAEIDADSVFVETDGGTVVLRGQVSSWRELDAAERAAWSAPGVERVKNRLEVKEPALDF
jgi:osmotically-inducible protein OsmY